MIDPVDDAALETWFAGVVERESSGPGPEGPTETVSYGRSAEQVADLWLPTDPVGAPVVVSIHGGAFLAEFDRSLHDPVARELARRGYAVWNIEYRRAGTGGLAETTADVTAAVDRLAALPGLRTDRVAVFGHSAGGYLAEWLAPHPAIELTVPLAAVTELPALVRSGRDDGGIVAWLGRTPDEDPELYAAADVRRRLPAGTRHVLVHGDADSTVDVAQSRDHVAAVHRSGDACELIELAGEGHYAFLDPREAACQALYDVLGTWRRPASPLLDASALPTRRPPGTPFLEER